MAYNEDTADRIRQTFYHKDIAFTEKKMFMSICFMVDEKMCICTHIDKKTDEDVLMCRLSELDKQTNIESGACLPMEMAGRQMNSFVFVPETSFRTQKQLDYWLQLCLDFNPLAKKSKKIKGI